MSIGANKHTRSRSLAPVLQYIFLYIVRLPTSVKHVKYTYLKTNKAVPGPGWFCFFIDGSELPSFSEPFWRAARNSNRIGSIYHATNCQRNSRFHSSGSQPLSALQSHANARRTSSKAMIHCQKSVRFPRAKTAPWYTITSHLYSFPLTMYLLPSSRGIAAMVSSDQICTVLFGRNVTLTNQ